MGVSWHKKSGGWMAQIRHERGTEFLGLFAESEEEKAARAYDAAARRLLSSSASGGSWLSSWPPCVLNFPSTCAGKRASNSPVHLCNIWAVS